MNMKKVISCLLIFAMVFVLIPFQTFADEAAATPAGTAITSAEELKATASSADGRKGTYYLANDITITGDWTYANFEGTFDGNGHTIYLDNATLNNGIFREVNNATLKNVTVRQKNTISFKLSNNNNYGTFIGRCTGTTTVENVKVYADITQYDSDNRHIGGVIGNMRHGTFVVRNCLFVGTIAFNGDKKSNYTGGIVGSLWAEPGYKTYATIENCASYGDYIAKSNCGGILGTTQSTSSNTPNFTELTVKNCVNYASVVSSGNENAAGIIGYINGEKDTKLNVSNNINYGVTHCEKDSNGKAGGIVGNYKQNGVAASSVISGNVNYGALTDGKAGAIVANAYGSDDRSTPTMENNFSVALTSNASSAIPATVPAIDDKTLATLNAAYENIYVTNEGKIALKWAVDAGYDSNVSQEVLDLNEIGKLTLDITVPQCPADATKITTAEGLAAIGATGTYSLENDITITGTWTSPKDFAGTLFGNGHTITFDGATVTGGLFTNLAGGKIYDLNLTESKGDNAKANTFETYTSSQKVLGTLAGYGYGTIVNVTANCSFGVASNDKTDYRIGGIIGRVDQGYSDSITGVSTAIAGCINYGDIQGAAAGGIVGVIYNSKSGKTGIVEISRCVNYGEITSAADQGVGGIVGRAAQNMPGLLVSDCINYGKIQSKAGQYTGGIVGLKLLDANGSFIMIRNINHGFVINNAMSEGAKKGNSGGLVGGINVQNKSGVDVGLYANVNYGIITGNASANQFVANVWNVGSAKVKAAFNYYAVDQSNNSVATTIYLTETAKVGDGTLAALNAETSNAFALQGEKIALKWAVDANITEDGIKKDDGSQTPGGNPGENPGGDTTETTAPSEPGTTAPSDTGTTAPSDTGTTAPSDTGTTAPSDSGTTAPSGTDNGTKEPSSDVEGCASSIAVSSLFIMIVAAAGVALVAKKKF